MRFVEDQPSRGGTFANGENWEYVPDRMGRIGRGKWKPKRQPGVFSDDARIEALRTLWRKGTALRDLFPEGAAALAESVGPRGMNRQGDVAKVQAMLDRAGYHDAAPTDGPTGLYSSLLGEEIKRFQRDSGVDPSGTINPGDETVGALKTQLADEIKPAAGTKPTSDGTVHVRAYERTVNGKTVEVSDYDRSAPAGHGGSGTANNRTQVAQVQALPAVLAGMSAAEAQAALTGVLTALGLGGVFGLKGDTLDQSNVQREALSDALVKEFTEPAQNSRGDSTTQKGNDIVARECKEVVETEFPHLVDQYDHFGGAHKDGGNLYQTEPYIPAYPDQDGTRGSSRADLGMNLGGPKKNIYLNTVDTLKDGVRPDARERRNFARLVQNIKDQIAHTMPKLRPGMNEDEYAGMARERCREIIRDAETKYGRPEGNDGKKGND